jgi:hypothetical protein
MIYLGYKLRKELIIMRYFMRFDTGFLIEANNHYEAFEKGWEFIHKNLPEDFEIDGSELSYFILDGEEEDE